MKWKQYLLFIVICIAIIPFVCMRNISSQSSIPFDGLYVKYEGIYGTYNTTLESFQGIAIYLTINYTFWKTDWYNFTITGNITIQGQINGSIFLGNRSMYYLSSTMNLTFSEGNHTPFFLIAPVNIGSDIFIAMNDTDYSCEVLGYSTLNYLEKAFRCFVLWYNDSSSIAYFDESTLLMIQSAWNVNPTENLYIFLYITEWNIEEAKPFQLAPIWWILIFTSILIGGLYGVGYLYQKRKGKKLVVPKKIIKKPLEKPSPISKIGSTLKKGLWDNKKVRFLLIFILIAFFGVVVYFVYDAMGQGDWLPNQFGFYQHNEINRIEGDIQDFFYENEQYIIYNGTGTILKIWIQFPYIDIYRDYDFKLILQYTGYSENKIQSISVYAHNTTLWFDFIKTKCYEYHRLVNGEIANQSIFTLRFNLRTNYITDPLNVQSFEGKYDTLVDGGHSFTFLFVFQFLNSGQSTLKIDQCVLIDRGSILNPF